MAFPLRGQPSAGGARDLCIVSSTRAAPSGGTMRITRLRTACYEETRTTVRDLASGN
jgi:hypothetical protein